MAYNKFSNYYTYHVFWELWRSNTKDKRTIADYAIEHNLENTAIFLEKFFYSKVNSDLANLTEEMRTKQNNIFYNLFAGFLAHDLFQVNFKEIAENIQQEIEGNFEDIRKFEMEKTKNEQ